MHQYPWISLNILDNFWINYDKALNMSAYEYVWQGFGDASGSKCPRVLKTARLYMQMLYRVPNMSEYGSVCLNNAWYASACFNVPLDVTQYARPWLNIAEFQIFKKFFVAQETIDLNISWPSNFFGKYFMAPPINFSFLFKAYL